ncbi:head GIN domain-containing protein [Flavitalea flava]
MKSIFFGYFKKGVLFVAFGLTGILLYAQADKVIRDDNAQAREVKGFHAIQISSGIDLYLSQGTGEKVVVSAASTQARDRIRTEVENGVLKIYIEQNIMGWGFHSNQKLKAYVSVRELDALRASGGSDVFLEEVLRTDKLDLAFSGGSDLRGKVAIRDLSIVQSGGSDLFLSGTASILSVHASGGSDLHGYDLLTSECHVEASGGSDVNITANKELSVHASGGSDVFYKGEAVMRELHSSGSSSVSKKS